MKELEEENREEENSQIQIRSHLAITLFIAFIIFFSLRGVH
jgi:hypothetical protein